jgi:hypothetical protein
VLSLVGRKVKHWRDYLDPAQIKHLIIDLTASISPGSHQMTRFYCAIQPAIMTVMHTYSLPSILMCQGCALLSATC